MSERDTRIDTFLDAAGWGGTRRIELPGDASFRRYERLEGGPRPAMLMDAPPPMEDVRPYVAVARHLNALGFSAPAIFAEDVEAGLLVIEDLGDDTFTRLLASGAPERELYTLATDVLIALHRHADAAAIDLPRYDERRLLDEAVLLVDWFLPAVTGSETEPRLRAEYEEVWRQVFPAAFALPETLVLRDFHVDNLMRISGRDGVAACGLLDFQDAVIGPVAYDLVSLLEDARRDVPEGVVAEMTARYLDAFPAFDRDAFAAGSAVLAAQRNAKIVGIFTRLSRRDGKDRYLAHIPRVWRLLERGLRHPALAPVAQWMDEVFTPGLRVAPPPRDAA